MTLKIWWSLGAEKNARYLVPSACKLAGTPSEDQDGSGDNNKCGVAGLDDGYCVFSNAVKQYLCAVPCTSVTLDCPAMDSTSCSSLPHASGTRNLCWL